MLPLGRSPPGARRRAAGTTRGRAARARAGPCHSAGRRAAPPLFADCGLTASRRDVGTLDPTAEMVRARRPQPAESPMIGEFGRPVHHDGEKEGSARNLGTPFVGHEGIIRPEEGRLRQPRTFGYRRGRWVAPTDVGVPMAWEVFEDRLLYMKFLALSEIIRQPLVAARPGLFVWATRRWIVPGHCCRRIRSPSTAISNTIPCLCHLPGPAQSHHIHQQRS